MLMMISVIKVITLEMRKLANAVLCTVGTVYSTTRYVNVTWIFAGLLPFVHNAAFVCRMQTKRQAPKPIAHARPSLSFFPQPYTIPHGLVYGCSIYGLVFHSQSILPLFQYEQVVWDVQDGKKSSQCADIWLDSLSDNYHLFIAYSMYPSV